MKAKLILLFVLVFSAVSFTQAQSKKELTQDLATCTAARDDLQKELSEITAKHDSLVQVYDSINEAYIIYHKMYKVIKEKIFYYAFDPTDMPALLDSLKTSRESAFSGLQTSLSDSIFILNKENAELKIANAILKADCVKRSKVVDDLQQLKELLDQGVITQQEFEAKKAALLEKL